MSNFVVVDSSSRHLTVAAAKDGKLCVRYLDDCAMKHSVVLMGEVEKAMDGVKLSPAECDFFGAVTGPGSFTGIRIGIATAKGLAMGAGKPLLGLTTFQLIAYNVNSENFCVVIDAAHSHFYAQGFGAQAFPPSYLSLSEVQSLGIPLYGFENLGLENYTRLLAKECLYPAVLKGEANLAEDIFALYVRKSQAEEGRK